jgi:hypothetical protein
LVSPATSMAGLVPWLATRDGWPDSGPGVVLPVFAVIML